MSSPSSALGRASSVGKLENFFLQETFEKIPQSIISVCTREGVQLDQVAKGEDKVIQLPQDGTAVLGNRVITWTGINKGAKGGEETLLLPAETTWLRVVRASEGGLTSYRAYKSRPPGDVALACDDGHPLQKCYGTSGFFRFAVGCRSCNLCGAEVRKGGLRWTCEKCDFDECLNCAEADAYERQMEGAGGDHRASVQTDPAALHQALGLTTPAVSEGQPLLTAASLAPPAAAGPSVRGGAFQVGEMAEVFSISQNKWLTAKVTAIAEDTKAVTVVYVAPNGSQVMKQLPCNHEHLRKPPPPPEEVKQTVAAAFMPPPRRSVLLREVARVSLRADPALLLGDKPMKQVQAETSMRLHRLIRHGDVHGARRALLKAQSLGLPAQDLQDAEDVLKDLQDEGEFSLLLPTVAGA